MPSQILNPLWACTLVLSAPAISLAQSYTITTAAGGATTYFYSGTGDGGPASSAGLANPCDDVAVDSKGNLYIAAGSLVREVSSSGTISTFAGGGTNLGEGIPATQAALEPIALAVDSANNLYIADTAYGFYRIRKVDSTGAITTVAGGAPCCALGDNGPAISAYIAIPYGIAVDGAGNIYIAQSNGQNNLIRKVTASNGTISTVAGGGSGGDGGPATMAALSQPTGIAVDSAGDLYIAESASNRIRQVTPAGTISTIAGTGASSTSGDGGPASKAGLNNPWHVAVDGSGNLYITQPNDARIRQVASSGTINTIAGDGTQGSTGDNGMATSATLDHPAGLALAANGGIYFAQDSAGIARVRLLTPTLGPPAILSNGVVPVYSSSTTVQSGSWISIYGSNFAAGTSVWTGNFPISLGGATVTIDSKPAYLWFVGPSQINAQVPDDATTGSVNVIVTTSAGTATSTVTLGPYAPSFSLYNAKYAAAIVLTSGPGNSGLGYDYIGPTGAFSFPTRPVKAGETLILFGVGFGPTSPAVPAGKIFSSVAPSVNLPQVTIGGMQANVSFAGIVEAGLFQLNVVVPPAPSGDQQLLAAIGGMTTPGNVTITMQ